MSEWNTTPFAHLLADSKDGEWGREQEEVGSRECIIIRGTDFAGLDNPDAEFPRRWIKSHVTERKHLQAGDIILETAGGTSTQSTGRTALLKKSFFDRHSEYPVLCASFSRHLRLHTDKYSPSFIYYLLQTLHRIGYMAVFNIQHTGVSRFQYTVFKNHTELRIPGPLCQQQIAAILSAYDELIENNKRRIALLEKLTQEVYREWFVRLRFPQYEKAKFVKGAPIDWQPVLIGELLKRIPPGKKYEQKTATSSGKVPILDQGQSGIIGYHDNEAGVIASPEQPVIVFANHTCYQRLICFSFSAIQNVLPFIPSSTIPSNIYWLHMATNGVVKLSEYKGHWPAFVSKRIYYPGLELTELFGAVVGPFFKHRYQLEKANETLVRTRDLLLPRLISGKLSVENLDIQFPATMTEELNAESPTIAHA